MFYPEDDPVPVGLISQVLVLEPLSIRHLELDYEAVMETKELLRNWSLSDWPSDDFTIEENAEDLSRHEEEHFDRIAFTYTILAPDASRCLGSVYISPLSEETIKSLMAAETGLKTAKYLAAVSFWVRKSELAKGLDRVLFDKLSYWLPEEFSFDKVLFVTSDKDDRQIELFTGAGLKQVYQMTTDDRHGSRLFFV